MLSAPGAARALSFSQFVDPNPASGNQFGATVAVLSTGNVVITSPFDNAGGADAGAVYLFNGATGALISTLRGSTVNDQVGSGGVTALTNGNYVVRSPLWDNGAISGAGAVTWGSGNTGVSGVVSAANSLVGSTASDQVGSGGVTALTNGNYVAVSQGWNNGAISSAGAATWGNGATGVSGAVSPANSLVGSTALDQVGSTGVTALTNGNYVVRSSFWNNGAIADAGAATWGNGATGVSGTVSAANSLVGSRTGDQVGGDNVLALTNGNYVVVCRDCDNGAIANVGAVTWGSGTAGVSGAVSAANSLVGSTANDAVGFSGVTALANGNYVVASLNWDNGAIANAGAATWGNGTSGTSGAVSAANSLVGSTASDQVGSSGVTPLTNGNYVVRSSFWDNGAITNVGAVTWGNGTTGVSGAVSAANSLVGSSTFDEVGNGGLTALTNGNYVVRSSFWSNGAISGAGAATWGSGTTGVSGTVSAANSLVGSTASDQVGSSGVTALANGNYVVASQNWDNGAIANVGAVTWGNGASGTSGAVSAANSLVGSTASDQVGSTGVTALTNGNYVVRSTLWDNGAIADVGAATWGNGTSVTSGTVSAANSLVGSTASDQVGFTGVTALTNGNYVVRSTLWDNGAATNVGAATWGSGTTGVSGVVSAANSLVGSTASDNVGAAVTVLTLGGYAVLSPSWDNGALANAGAMTSGLGAVTGAVSAANSIVGAAFSAGLASVAIEDTVNATLIARFPTESGGRVRAGASPRVPVIASAADIPGDQGGWLRLTFLRSAHDDASAWTPISSYGVWRHIPGTLPARTREAGSSAAHAPGAEGVARLRSSLPATLDVREVDGRLYASGSRAPRVEIAAAFPPGTWELVMSVPAVQQAQYAVAVPTISNAASDDYVVTAHTTTPSIWFVSNTMSGQSMDNLAPAQPAGLTAAYSGGQTNLEWATNGEHDLGTYRLYRGSSADFTPSLANRIATPSGTSYADIGPAGSYYKLSAADVNGNESTFALITPAGTTDAGAGAATVFGLDGALPNPARRNGLHVTFTLPSTTPARLELLDVGGRRVRALEVGALGPGRHTVNLAENRGVPAGIYWVRLTQGADHQHRRVSVIE